MLEDMLRENCIHLCIDMQNVFLRETPWHMPWMRRILPCVVALSEKHPDRNVFTRFLPAAEPGEGHGMWKSYYLRWAEMTLKETGTDIYQLVPELDALARYGLICDKKIYAPWMSTDLHARLRERNINTLIVSGGETDVCVLATVLGAVDMGYRVIIATDALCSSSDATHDAILKIFHERYNVHIATATTEDILSHWK